MSKLYKLVDWESGTGKIHVTNPDMIAHPKADISWSEPARILGVSVVDFLDLLRNEYGATLTPYRKDGKISFVGYHWTNLAQARKFKNDINRRAREQKYMI